MIRGMGGDPTHSMTHFVINLVSYLRFFFSFFFLLLEKLPPPPSPQKPQTYHSQRPWRNPDPENFQDVGVDGKRGGGGLAGWGRHKWRKIWGGIYGDSRENGGGGELGNGKFRNRVERVGVNEKKNGMVLFWYEIRSRPELFFSFPRENHQHIFQNRENPETLKTQNVTERRKFSAGRFLRTMTENIG